MTVQELTTRLLTRLGDDPNAAQNQQYYTQQEALNWINAVQRVFVLLTLCLEKTATFELRDDGSSSYHLMDYYADWLAPLRVRLNGGLKLRPARLADFSAYDNRWRVSPGTPTKYALSGFDLFSVNHQPTATTSLDITFARCPATLMNPTDVPEIPQEYHPLLIDGAIPIMRAKEGAQELSKVRPLWDRYLDGAQRLGNNVRARNREQQYDMQPIELTHFDRSRILGKAA